ncbi:MAG TPA: putative aminohydrolase SsnA [Anaerolineae bacterium]|nr:putative aminohydrolase SsnA [Anaerolineae bacterium]
MLITNGTVITLGAQNAIIPSGAVLIRSDKIAAVGDTRELAAQHPDEEILDAHGKLVMPGNICAHTHFYGAFARGMALPPGPPPKSFPEILEKLWWRIDRALTLEDSQYSALVCLVDAIRHGTTTLIDHHASPNAIEGSLDAIANAVQQSGLRACLCYEVTDRNGEEGARAGIRENVRFIKASERSDKSNVAATFGLHASFTVSDKTLERCLTELDGMNTGFHVHVAEDRADEDDAIQSYGMRVGDRLNARGILGEKTIAAHCVHVDVQEIDLFKRTHTKVSHQPRSNMNNAVGVANVLGMMRYGVTVGLGNDGFSNNMFSEMKTAYLLHKSHQHDPRVMGADQVLKMAFANNAKICANFWNAPLGVIAPGAYADIILLDYLPFTDMTAGNFPWHVVFGIDGSNVTHTICGGQLLMRDRELLTLDEEAITAKAHELSRDVWKRVRDL